MRAALHRRLHRADKVIARMTTPPTAARAALIAALLTSLETADILSQLSGFYMLAAADAQAASLNWLGDEFTLAPANAPTFEADRGYTGNGTTQEILTDFNPALVGGKYALDNACQFSWSRTDVNAAQADIGNFSSRILSRSGGNLNVRPNNGGGPGTDAVASSVGFSSWSRDDAANYEAYKNGALLSSHALASAGITSAQFCILSQNASAFSTRQIACAGWGLSLTAAQHLALYTAINTYLTAVGAA